MQLNFVRVWNRKTKAKKKKKHTFTTTDGKKRKRKTKVFIGSVRFGAVIRVHIDSIGFDYIRFIRIHLKRFWYGAILSILQLHSVFSGFGLHHRTIHVVYVEKNIESRTQIQTRTQFRLYRFQCNVFGLCLCARVWTWVSEYFVSVSAAISRFFRSIHAYSDAGNRKSDVNHPNTHTCTHTSTNQRCALGVVATSKAVERWKFIAVFNLCAALEEISRVIQVEKKNSFCIQAVIFYFTKCSI